MNVGLSQLRIIPCIKDGYEKFATPEIATISARTNTVPWCFLILQLLEVVNCSLLFLLSDSPICNDEDPNNKNPRK